MLLETPILEDPKEDQHTEQQETEKASTSNEKIDVKETSTATDSKAASENKETIKISVENETDDKSKIETKDDNKKKGQNDLLKPTDEPSSSQPIFKPLTSDKGKSKSSGRNIGGWL